MPGYRKVLFGEPENSLQMIFLYFNREKCYYFVSMASVNYIFSGVRTEEFGMSPPI